MTTTDAGSHRPPLQLGFIGLGRMGFNMVQRLVAAKIACVVYDTHEMARQQAVKHGAAGAASLADLVAQLPAPRAIWLMIPTAAVDAVLSELAPHLAAGDVVVDGGNSHYHADLRRAAELGRKGVQYLDVGVSGGVWGRERGYCQMIGGPQGAYRRLEPVFQALAPGHAAAPRTLGRAGDPTPAEQGYLYCGPSGAGHFVKMVHNGIEYGLMEAYAEGLNVLHHANVGTDAKQHVNAETTPLEHPEHYQYEFALADITEVWRRGSVIGSWLLDLTAGELVKDAKLDAFEGRVSDSGEGRWTALAAIEEGVPVPVLSTALYARLDSRGHALFAGKILSAMRNAFGGHDETKADRSKD